MSVDGLGDVNRDDIPDLISGEPYGNYDDGVARIHCGRTGSVFRKFVGTGVRSGFGNSVAKAGDQDQDGFTDVMVGAWVERVGNLNHAGAVHVYSTRSGELIRLQPGKAAGDTFGYSVAFVGDTDADGFPEVLSGALNAKPNGIGNAGSAFLFSVDPFLNLDSQELSATQGTPIQADTDFPNRFADHRYGVLLSLSGRGPTLIDSVEIPLTSDHMFFRTAGNQYPLILSNGRGTLDSQGRATASFLLAQQLPITSVPQSIIAVVSLDPTTGLLSRSSVSRSVIITP